ncbi:hypothetical protein SERLA73DRAFT_78425 [Serpula lacrymans var. lacrymans S7.3]|uniref:Uncharacterized protein n=1 Tax=Serpula lacrymans var. lacrymans (strain S7.3) TaxID=936435 RepID=F8QD63_SERL3|nr:hypothetical protein SERLA73DRAFT_78425 [Serpula lacrymans var. lacrymans S7.3]
MSRAFSILNGRHVIFQPWFVLLDLREGNAIKDQKVVRGFVPRSADSDLDFLRTPGENGDKLGGKMILFLREKSPQLPLTLRKSGILGRASNSQRIEKSMKKLSEVSRTS